MCNVWVSPNFKQTQTGNEPVVIIVDDLPIQNNLCSMAKIKLPEGRSHENIPMLDKSKIAIKSSIYPMENPII